MIKIGWVRFRARFIKLLFLFRFRRKMNPKKVLTGGGGDRLRGPNARVNLEQPIIKLQTFVSLPTKKNYDAQTPSSPYPSFCRPMRELSAGRAVYASGTTKKLRRLTSAAEKIDFLR